MNKYKPSIWKHLPIIIQIIIICGVVIGYSLKIENRLSIVETNIKWIMEKIK